MIECKKVYKIEGLFNYCMENKDFNYKYRNNSKYDNGFTAQKDFFKEIGFNNIIALIKNIVKDYIGMELKILEKKYNKNDNNRYIKIEIINTNVYFCNVFENQLKDLKEVERKINDALWDVKLYALNELAA